MGYLLKNLKWNNGTENVGGDIRITKRFISEIGPNLSPRKDDVVADYEGHFIYPGLINSHDHIEMNLYPKLGNPPYYNYVEWAKDIYHPGQSPLREIQTVNIQDRLMWGGLKNLISGVTTVIHHNPWNSLLGEKEFPVKVPKVAWAHSLEFEKKSRLKLPKKNNQPFIIHAAEGIDELSFAEVPMLNLMNLLKLNTVLVHAIALTPADIEILARSQASVVWCPASNLYMFNQTASILEMRTRVKVALGSDSTLTGSPTFLHEMQTAAKTNLVSAREIYDMVTRIPAGIFSLVAPAIMNTYPADVFIAPVRHPEYFANLVNVQPGDISMIMTDGMPRLTSLDTASIGLKFKHRVNIQGKLKACDFNVAALKKRIQSKVDASILEKNQLWNLMEA